MTEPLIRIATRDDLPAIVAMLADDDIGRARERFEDPLPVVYTDAFAAIDADPNNQLAVIELDGAVVGCLQLTIIPNLSRTAATRAMIEGVRIARQARGMGFGRKLFAWAIARAGERDCEIVQLTADKSRAEAHEFYKSLGFEGSHIGFKLYL